jgi:hypothetical protein
MASKQAVEEKEETIRKLVRELPDNSRLMFFKESDKKLKDPDTYAVLNYIFIAGLHHFYLGLFNGYTSIGVIIIAAITILEFYELFQSEIIVKEHNNSVMEQIYHDVQKA